MSDEEPAAGRSEAVYQAARRGDVAAAAMLLATGAPSGQWDDRGDTPLHAAAAKGYTEMAGLLLSNGASPNARDQLGRTPLHVAARKGRKGVTAALLAFGADLDAADSEAGYLPLHCAVLSGRRKTVELLLGHGADVSQAAEASGEQPLHCAAREGNLELAKLLLEQGADPSATDAEGRTPLDVIPRDPAEGQADAERLEALAEILRGRDLEPPAAPKGPITYTVYIEDSSHAGEGKGYQHSEHRAAKAAIAEAQKIVDEYLASARQAGMTADELYQSYRFFGEAPYIVSDDPECTFSARGYAEQRCRELCGGKPGTQEGG